MKLNLKRPLAFIDIESTGVNIKRDRIIDLAIVKLLPDGSRDTQVFRVNPGMPIPKISTSIHGITDEDVKDSPLFATVAQKVADCLKDCDIAGYGIIQFDIPLLEEEFRRASVKFGINDRSIIDSLRIFHMNEPRDLSAAVSFYCNGNHEDAHTALADVEATIKVLEGQFAMYYDLPTDPVELSDYCCLSKPDWVDRTGKLVWGSDDEATINFGKNQGRKLKDLVKTDRSFLDWILRKDFPHDFQEIIREALAGKFPVRS